MDTEVDHRAGHQSSHEPWHVQPAGHLPTPRVRFAQHDAPVQTRIVISAYPLFRRAMIRALGVIPSRADRALEEVRTIFDEVSDQIRDRRFLVGESFSLADLTFASLASLALGVSHDEGYGAVMPSLERYPEPARSVMRELRATEAGKFALRMYAEERRRVTRGSTGRMAPTTIEHPAITKITRCGGC